MNFDWSFVLIFFTCSQFLLTFIHIVGGCSFAVILRCVCFKNSHNSVFNTTQRFYELANRFNQLISQSYHRFFVSVFYLHNYVASNDSSLYMYICIYIYIYMYVYIYIYIYKIDIISKKKSVKRYYLWNIIINFWEIHRKLIVIKQ